MGIEELCLGVVTKKKQLFNKDIDDLRANDIPSLIWGILATSEYQLCSQNNRFNVSLQSRVLNIWVILVSDGWHCNTLLSNQGPT